MILAGRVVLDQRDLRFGTLKPRVEQQCRRSISISTSSSGARSTQYVIELAYQIKDGVFLHSSLIAGFANRGKLSATPIPTYALRATFVCTRS